MPRFPGFTIEKLMITSGAVRIYSGIRNEDQKKISLKVVPDNDPHLVRCYQQEYGLLRKLNLSGILNAQGLIRTSGYLALVFDYSDGELLQDYLGSHSVSSRQFLEIAIRLAKTLSEIHGAGVLHKAIKPFNVLIGPGETEVKLTGFDHATLIEAERDKVYKSRNIQGSLFYISPEQTGRMGRGLDFRSDLYSLGVTFYEIVTGKPPFLAEPNELIHLHLAVMPRPPGSINQELPEMVSRIIMKLLMKDPAARYQSASGLLSDLEHCQRQLSLRGKIESFDLGRMELRETLFLPQKLYGRDREIDLLTQCYHRILEGEKHLVLIHGQAGVGKTALTDSLEKTVSDTRGVFLRGGAQRFQRSMPYACLAGALAEWVERILGGSDQELSEWKYRLSKALGSLAPLLTEVIPNISLLVSSEREVADTPQPGTNQLGQALTRLVATIARADRPLVLILDGFHWADKASRALINQMMSTSDMRYLMLILCYRDGELSGNPSGQPRRFDVLFTEHDPLMLPLPPWDGRQLNAFLADALERLPLETRQLGELVERKTGGNPLLVRQFLLHLHQLRLIRFEDGAWQWKLDAIDGAELPENIAGVMTRKLSGLDERALLTLRTAAAIGSRFDLTMLLTLRGVREDELLLDLSLLTFEGLITPLQRDYRFSHPRIHEAALGLSSSRELAYLHYQIGTIKLERMFQGSHSQNIFEILDHLNQGLSFMNDQERRNQLAGLNLMAGNKALDTSSYDMAFSYYSAGIELMTEVSFAQFYQLKFNLHLMGSQAAFLAGKFDEAQRLLAVLEEQNLDLPDRARVIARAIMMHHQQGFSTQAVSVGLAGLGELGLSINPKPPDGELYRLAARLRLMMMRFSPSAIADLPHTSDENILARGRVLLEVMVPAFLCNLRMASYLVQISMISLLQNGHHPYSPMTVALYAMMAGLTWGSLERREAYGKLAIDLQKKFGHPKLSHRIRLVVGYFIEPWVRPLRECAAPLSQPLSQALEHGDRQFVVYTATCQIQLKLFAGEPLPDVCKATADSIALASELGYGDVHMMLDRFLFILSHLTGERVLSTGDDPLHLAQLESLEIRLPFFYCGPHVVWLWYLMGNYEKAFTLAARLDKSIAHTTAMGPQIPFHKLFLGLSAAALHEQKPKKLYLEIVAKTRRAMNDYARHMQRNFSTHAHLLEAEWYRLRGKQARALHCYAQAQESARAEEFTMLLAITLHRRSSMARLAGFEGEAASLLHQAREEYHKWGAMIVVKQLDNRLPDQERKFEREPIPDPAERLTGVHAHLDLDTVIQSSLAISREVELEKALERIMSCAVEIAGAERALLFRRRERGLWLEAEGRADDTFLRDARELEEVELVPYSIVKYVQRTGETVVLGDGRSGGSFASDPYLMSGDIRSVLALPVTNQNKFIGVLYLENNLVSEAFTRDRLEVLRVIAAQAAVSLENASLYQRLNRFNRELEARVERRTSELRKANEQLTREIKDRIEAQDELVRVQSKLVEAARRAGMTDVAVSVLHNVGNVLNSVTISVASLAEDINNSKLPRLKRLVDLVGAEDFDPIHFFTNDERGRIFPEYLTRLYDTLANERAKARDEVESLTAHLSHTIEVIRAQQDHAGIKALLEPCKPGELMDEAIKIAGLGIENKGIIVRRKYRDTPTVLLERHKIMQILLNLVTNAVQALGVCQNQIRQLEVDVYNEGINTCFVVKDNGIGIDSKNLTHIFTYGFTTREDGHGFGLHNSANAAVEMSGHLRAESEGPGKGATFILELPLRPHQTSKRQPATT